MPFMIERLSNGKYMVFNEKTGHIFSKGTTKKRAESQVKFLHMVDNVQRMNFNPNWENNYHSR